VVQQVDRHLPALAEAFAELRPLAGDLGTATLAEFRRQVSLLEDLDLERLTSPEKARPVIDDLTRLWYSRRQIDLLLVRMRERRMPPTVSAWLRRLLETRATDLPTIPSEASSIPLPVVPGRTVEVPAQDGSSARPAPR
jgi:hypothetical protein